jgi:hypothetical protein
MVGPRRKLVNGRAQNQAVVDEQDGADFFWTSFSIQDVALATVQLEVSRIIWWSPKATPGGNTQFSPPPGNIFVEPFGAWIGETQ